MHVMLQILIVSAVVSGVLHSILYSRLRARHHHTWMALGRPTIWIGRVAVLRFLLRREYYALGDAKLVRLARFLRGYLLAFAVFLLVFFFAWLISH